MWKLTTLFFKWKTEKFAKLIAKVIATKINSHQVMPLKHKNTKVANLSSLKKLASFLNKIGSLLLWENCSKAWIIFYEFIISFSRSGNKKFTKLAQGEDCYKNNLHQHTAVIRKQRNSLRNSGRLSRFRQIT